MSGARTHPIHSSVKCLVTLVASYAWVVAAVVSDATSPMRTYAPDLNSNPSRHYAVQVDPNGVIAPDAYHVSSGNLEVDDQSRAPVDETKRNVIKRNRADDSDTTNHSRLEDEFFQQSSGPPVKDPPSSANAPSSSNATEWITMLKDNMSTMLTEKITRGADIVIPAVLKSVDKVLEYYGFNSSYRNASNPDIRQKFEISPTEVNMPINMKLGSIGLTSFSIDEFSSGTVIRMKEKIAAYYPLIVTFATIASCLCTAVVGLCLVNQIMWFKSLRKDARDFSNLGS